MKDDPGDWEFGPTIGGKLYSYDEESRPVSMRRTGDGALAFDIPKRPGQVDYLTRGGRDLRDFQALRMVFDLRGNGNVVAVGESSVDARVRLFFQRAGDNWSGRGKYEHFRWWSAAFAELGEGDGIEVHAELDHRQWTSVYGQTNEDGFRAAMRDARSIGMTFGGTYAGHGVRVRDGDATFVLRRFEAV